MSAKLTTVSTPPVEPLPLPINPTALSETIAPLRMGSPVVVGSLPMNM